MEENKEINLDQLEFPKGHRITMVPLKYIKIIATLYQVVKLIYFQIANRIINLKIHISKYRKINN